MQRNRHVTDFIEKQGSAHGHFDLADRLFVRACERSFFVTEEFRLKQIFGNSRAVDRDKILLHTRAQPVQRTGEQFLARTALAEQQGGDIRGCDFLDHAAHGQHAFTRGNNAVER